MQFAEIVFLVRHAYFFGLEDPFNQIGAGPIRKTGYVQQRWLLAASTGHSAIWFGVHRAVCRFLFPVLSVQTHRQYVRLLGERIRDLPYQHGTGVGTQLRYESALEGHATSTR